MEKFSRLTCALFSLCMFSAGIAAKQPVEFPEMRIASDAEQWQARSIASKDGYLEGLCNGLGNSNQNKIAELFCNDAPPSGKTKRAYRFCGIRAGDPTKAIAIADQFYSNTDHSDLAAWVLVASYNDQSCGENLIKSRMSSMQKKFKCHRMAANMLNPAYSPEAQRKQIEFCNSLDK